MIDMGRFKYAFQNFDATKHVRSSLREKDISHKHAREVAVAIKGLSIEKARDYLQAVINKERAIAFPLKLYMINGKKQKETTKIFLLEKLPDKVC